MAEPACYLETIQPELENVARLFELSFAQQPFRYEMYEHDGRYVCVFSDETHTVTRMTDVPDDADERLRILHRKRAARRLCKQTLYDLCREVTGIHPPWGSLTGIRPTHLIREAMADGMDRENAAKHLMTAFDVTEEKARLLYEITQTQDQLPPPGDRFMDVYIGIPFCTTRCTYCSFSSGEIGGGKLVKPYMNALVREIRAGKDLLAAAGKELRAVYVGGGTPTALPETEFGQLLDEMMSAFPGAREYTVEAGRPDTLSEAKLKMIRDSGTGRISINPQTMNDRTLRVIGRMHTAQQVIDAYGMAREAGIGHINMDVIAGLPGETADDFGRTMEAALQLKPESLTVHTLAIKRSSRMHLENAPLPDGGMTADMVRMGRETARMLGMQPYYMYRQKYMAGNQENTGYALTGHACLYNVDIMEETSHILALGAGGISKRIFPEEGHIGRSPNVSNIEQYIERVDEMIGRKKELFEVL
ncbi:MAG: coproporphyrinogen dehydrogenase HemZ [Clostridia bacterium]|nr:coproporphyrinogen dehydrogenase HemZ [Clostridia bacterium]